MDRNAPFRWIKDCAVWLSHPYREYDRRRSVRFPADMEAILTVSLGVVKGRTVNLSRGGVSVLVPEEIAPETVVLVRFPSIDRSGFAHVRRCVARGDGYELALQFREGLRLDDRTQSGFDYRREAGRSAWNDPDA